MAQKPNGQVGVCKTLVVGSIPTCASVISGEISMSIELGNIGCGTYFDYDRPGYCKSLSAFEDDHGLYIEISDHESIRIEPQEFPKLIALMAQTMDGMVEF